MAPKRSSLFGETAPARALAEPEAAPEPARPQAPPAIDPAEAAPTTKYPKAKTREGKRVATCYLEREAHRQLQKIVFDEETTMQDLLVEGINAVFERRGLSRIA